MSDDPWTSIATPTSVDAITAKRVDAAIPWDFFWGRSMDQKCLFALQHDEAAKPTYRLPQLKGIDLSLRKLGDDNSILLFRLQDNAHRDIFHQLCRDIVSATTKSASQKEAVMTAIARTWRWHHLLRGGSTGLLSAEEQKGLVAELITLERYVLECFSPDDGLDMWRGPLEAPKDFECAKVCIEAKARRGAATPFVQINSAEQLDTTGVDALFLLVVELDPAPANTINAFTLADAAARLRERLSTSHAATLAFENLLEAAGFRWTDDYAAYSWLEGNTRIYRVSDSFPRISANLLPPGVSRVIYSLSLVSCAPHEVPADTVIQQLKGTQHA